VPILSATFPTISDAPFDLAVDLRVVVFCAILPFLLFVRTAAYGE
jgi:hypothetical protein